MKSTKMNEIIDNIIFSYSGISLSEMDGVKLMDRTDKKYVFHSSELAEIMEEMRMHYKILDIEKIRIHTYETLYLDTPDFELFLMHQNERLNRYKIRIRKYLESKLSFFEIKFKNNKGRTIKRRVKIKGGKMELGEEEKKLLETISPYTFAMLEPKLWVKCMRMTFVGIHTPERITIDLNLQFYKPEKEDEILSYPEMVITEVKQEKTMHDSPFIRAIRKRNIREVSISKYCFGVYEMFDNVKKNNFKPKIRFINKCAGFRPFNKAV